MRHYVAIATLVSTIVPMAALADDATPPVVGGHTYIQHQIELAKARYPSIAAITVESKREKGEGMIVLGSTANIGQVMHEVAYPRPDGTSGSTVREAFNSSSGHRLGTIEIVFKGRQPGGK